MSYGYGSNQLTHYSEPALTFAEQLARVQAGGIKVQDPAKALQALASVSYYRLKVYWHPFLPQNNANAPGDASAADGSFEQALALYEFDRQLRLLVMDVLERFEVLIRTAVTYHIGHSYGAMGHERPENFHPSFEHKKWIKHLHGETARSRDPAIRDFKFKYSQDFPVLPIWMVSELISLGSMSRLYWGMLHEDKRAIATPFRVHHKRLANWLHVLTYVRNVGAHHGRLWNRNLAIQPKAMKSLLEWQAPVTPRTDRIFYVLLMLRHLMRGQEKLDDWAKQCEMLLSPVVAMPRWRIEMGFPENWAQHPIWTGVVSSLSLFNRPPTGD